MTHEPVSLVIEWLRPALAAVTDRVASLLPDGARLPAVAVTNATGAPISTAGGIDTLYDYTVTVYCFGGRTGAGQGFPDYQAAHSCAALIVSACRSVAAGVHWNDGGASVVDAEVIAITRAVDDLDGAIVTVTLAVRIAD
jgi:hypothetical protein